MNKFWFLHFFLRLAAELLNEGRDTKANLTLWQHKPINQGTDPSAARASAGKSIF